MQGELLSDVDLWLSLELDVLLDLLGLLRGDVAPLLPVGGGEPLGLPGGGEAVPGAPTELGGWKGGRRFLSTLVSVHRPLLGFIIIQKSEWQYFTFVLISPGLRPGAVLISKACWLNALNLSWK